MSAKRTKMQIVVFLTQSIITIIISFFIRPIICIENLRERVVHSMYQTENFICMFTMHKLNQFHGGKKDESLNIHYAFQASHQMFSAFM